MILGGGPNRIGQGIEFDCVRFIRIREAGFETVMNSNPETMSTDYDLGPLYFERSPSKAFRIIYYQERCDGAIVR